MPRPHRYILPIMVSVIVSKWVGDAFGRDGIYDEQVSPRAVGLPAFCFRL